MLSDLVSLATNIKRYPLENVMAPYDCEKARNPSRSSRKAAKQVCTQLAYELRALGFCCGLLAPPDRPAALPVRRCTPDAMGRDADMRATLLKPGLLTHLRQRSEQKVMRCVATASRFPSVHR